MFLLDLFLEAALLQQLVCLIQDKQSDAGGGQHAQLDKLLDTTCVRTRNSSNKPHKQVMAQFIFSCLLTRGAHGDMAPLQVMFVLTHRSAADENMALQALHGTAYCHYYRVDLYCDLTRRGKNKNLQEVQKSLFINWVTNIRGSQIRATKNTAIS